jgi:hypothetical protein
MQGEWQRERQHGGRSSVDRGVRWMRFGVQQGRAGRSCWEWTGGGLQQQTWVWSGPPLHLDAATTQHPPPPRRAPQSLARTSLWRRSRMLWLALVSPSSSTAYCMEKGCACWRGQEERSGGGNQCRVSANERVLPCGVRREPRVRVGWRWIRTQCMQASSPGARQAHVHRLALSSAYAVSTMISIPVVHYA